MYLTGLKQVTMILGMLVAMLANPWFGLLSVSSVGKTTSVIVCSILWSGVFLLYLNIPKPPRVV
jgi:hypothetical protein